MRTYVLCGGRGSRLSPYSTVRPKTLVPVLGRPVIAHILDAASKAGLGDVRVLVDSWETDVRGAVAGRGELIGLPPSDGSAAALRRVWEPGAPAIVLHGDVLVHGEDLAALRACAETADAGDLCLLLSPIEPDETRDWIGARTAGGEVTAILGHPREGTTHRIAGFALPGNFGEALETTPAHFPSVEVGMMPPAEPCLEAAVETWRAAGGRVRAVAADHPTYDIDKPWHILQANRELLREAVAAIPDRDLADGAAIDESARVAGKVRLGVGSRIGHNVTVRGNLIAGDDVLIDTGAIINGDCFIGPGSRVSNGCYLEDGAVIGAGCVVSHGAELDGLLFGGVYLYHYMEIYGIVGENTDIGAATVCGSLRFDDGETSHRIKGRRETPRLYSNACFIGDYCRTGVNAILMPGCKIGPYGIVGPGVVLDRDLPPNTGVRVRQQLEEFSWGPERYGW